MSKWKNEDEMFALMREKLYTPVVGDILDQKGYVHQFLPPDIRPLNLSSKLAGCSICKSSHHRWGLLCIMKAIWIRTRGLLAKRWWRFATRPGLPANR